MTYPYKPTQADRNAALPYLMTAWLSLGLVVLAVGFGLWACIRFGPAGGLTALAGAVWLARAARAAMPPDLLKRFQ